MTMKKIILFLFIASSLVAQGLGGDVYFKKDLWKLLTSTTISPVSSTYGTSALFSSLTDGTDTYKMLVSSDKWTLQNDAGSPASLVSIDSAGNVGIGTISPDKKFGIGNGTDEFSQDVTSDKWTLWNDAGTPASLVTVDSVGNTTVTGIIGNSAQQTITLGAGATTLAVTKNVITVTGDAGANTIATITGAVVGTYVFIFVDGLVTITDTDAHTANTVDLAGTATNFTSADDKTLTLVFDGTSWYQISTSTN
jgi:molybdopterin-binding protein